VRLSQSDLTRHTGKEISLLYVAALAGTIHDPSGGAFDERNAKARSPDEASKLGTPARCHAANGLTARRIATEDLAKSAHRDLAEALSIAAPTIRR
jgi:hypothetical protein